MADKQALLDQIDELVEDLAFEIAHRLDWVDLVRRDLPPLTAEQEQTLRDMADAFAADQLLDRELDGDPLGASDRAFVREVVTRLADRYAEGLQEEVVHFLQRWSAPVR